MKTIDEIIKNMSLEDKISIATGADFWHTKRFDKYGVPDFMMSDGPHGLRCQAGAGDMIGINKSIPSTCFPAAVTAGATWNKELYAEEGKAIGEEALSVGVSVVLGPGCNIKRNPLCGRNFEYISEDPFFAGEMAASFINGQQSTGVSSSLKHFALNSQEFKRQNGDSQADERTIREIYLSAFETAVKKSQPGTVMCSYNKINGIHASDNKWLLSDVLRDEWGFKGLVVTDWGALNDRIEGFKAGCDLTMPGGSKYMEKEALEAVKSGRLSEADIDKCVRRILELTAKSEKITFGGEFSVDDHDDLACRIAEQGAVLLKNEDGILPASSDDMVLIGYMADDFRYQGAGSSHINPLKLASLKDSLPGVPYVSCGDKYGNVNDSELNIVVQEASKHKVAVVVAGLPDSYESEGFDRSDIKMPDGHLRMIDAVAEANPNTVVVLLGGGVIEIPWADKVKAILFMGLSGQAGGRACANLITGKVSPSGKLTESWPYEYSSVICSDTFGMKNTEYREGVYVGYRYYDKSGTKVRYPFGYGLSYTSFEYSDLRIEGNTVTVTVKNVGSCSGAEIVQLYVKAPQDGLFRPLKELRGFERVELSPNEAGTISFTLDERSFALWNDGWKVPSGKYEILIGSSSQDIKLSAEYTIEGEIAAAPDWQIGSWYDTLSGKPSREEWENLMGHKVPLTKEKVKGEFDMDSTCLEMRDSSFIMKIQYKITEGVVAKGFDGKKDYSDPAFKMMMVCAADCPMRSVVMSVGGGMPDGVARGLVSMANGHFFTGIKQMLTK